MLLKNKIFRLLLLLFVIYSTNEKWHIPEHTVWQIEKTTFSLPVPNAHAPEESHFDFVLESRLLIENSVKLTESSGPSCQRINTNKKVGNLFTQRCYQSLIKTKYFSYFTHKIRRVSIQQLYIAFRSLII